MPAERKGAVGSSSWSSCNLQDAPGTACRAPPVRDSRGDLRDRAGLAQGRDTLPVVVELEQDLFRVLPGSPSHLSVELLAAGGTIIDLGWMWARYFRLRAPFSCSRRSGRADARGLRDVRRTHVRRRRSPISAPPPLLPLDGGVDDFIEARMHRRPAECGAQRAGVGHQAGGVAGSARLSQQAITITLGDWPCSASAL